MPDMRDGIQERSILKTKLLPIVVCIHDVVTANLCFFVVFFFLYIEKEI
jgi:hypothetical protein